MNGWVLAELAAAALAVSVVVAAAAGRWLRGRREGREAAGEHPAPPGPGPLTPPSGYRSRAWLIAGARVLHEEHGLGTVVTSSPGSCHIGVRFDDGPGRWVAPDAVDPITPDDEHTYQRMLARRPFLNDPREDHP